MNDEAEEERPNVLIVEDETALAEMYGCWLDEEYAVEIATETSSALARVDESVDVVILDRHLPDGCGDDVLSTIRDRGLACRVAMVTGIDPAPDIVDMPFDEYLCKPVSRAELLATTRRLLARSAYSEVVDEFYTVSRKKRLLESYCSRSVLSSNEEYAALEARYGELRDRLIDITSSFGETEFQTELAQIQREAAN